MITRPAGARFEMLERVGDSPVFQVFKVRDKGNGRIVAIKSLQPEYAPDAAFCAALQRSVPGLIGLVHPNIARVEELGDDDGTPFLVTEFVRGINLKERIRRIAPFTLAVATDFAIAIAEALQHAHTHGVSHGDLRPHNVIISPEGQVKVTDFGLQSALSDSHDGGAANLSRSAAYRAPEVSAGSKPGSSADVYALGAILFEMLTGSAPPIADGAPGEQPPSPRQVNSGVPKSVDGIVMKAMLRRPSERYASAADMLADLRAVRDALRFGKSLSWSPLDIGRAYASPAVQVDTPAAPRTAAQEPEMEGAARMAATTNPTVRDDSVSLVLRAANYALVFIVVTALIGFTAFWMAASSKVPEAQFPSLIGLTMDAAKQQADRAGVHLIEHEVYNEQTPRGVIYQTDLGVAAGRTIRPGRHINVWVSKGSRMVYVPDLVGLHKDEAQQKLQEAGMQLGEVNRVNDDRVPFDHILSQNPRARKRVNREIPLNLTISDGPTPGHEATPPDNTDQGNGSDNGNSNTSTTPLVPPSTLDGNGAANQTPGPGATLTNPSGSPAAGTDDSGSSRANEIHTVNLTKRIPRDGLGTRRVRIEYDDSQGTHTPIDEEHDEGDVASQRVDVYGSKITVRLYYGDSNTPVSTNTMTFSPPR